MKKRATALVLMIPLIALCAPIDRAATWCQKSDDHHVIPRLTKFLSDSDRVIPQIPSEEIRYFELEHKQIIDQASGFNREVESRFEHLRARRLYFAWKARKALEKATKSVAHILEPRNFDDLKNPEATKLVRALQASTDLRSYNEDVSEFFDTETRRKDSFIDSKSVERLPYVRSIIDFSITDYMRCKTAKIAQ